MKYKKICCILSAMLVINPQYIMADGLPEQSPERNSFVEETWEREEEPDESVRDEIYSEISVEDQMNSEREYLDSEENISGESIHLDQDHSLEGESEDFTNPGQNSGGVKVGDGEKEQETSAGVNLDKDSKENLEESTGVEQDKESKQEQEESTGQKQDEENKQGQEESTGVEKDKESKQEQEESADIDQANESKNGKKENIGIEGVTDEENMGKDNLGVQEITGEEFREDETNQTHKVEESIENEGTFEHEAYGGGETEEQKLSVPEKDELQEIAENMEEQPKPEPRITVNNLQQFSANSRTVIPEIIIEYPIQETSTVELILESRSKGVLNQQISVKEVDGKLCYSLPEIKDDDQYILRIKNHSSDKTYEQAVVFSVNRTGTVFQYDESKSEVTLSETFTPQINLQNIDSTEVLSCMVNGRETPFDRQGDQIIVSEEFLKEGKNQIVVAVKDQAGNVSIMDPWEFMICHPKEERDVDGAMGEGKKEGGWKYLFLLIETLLLQLGNGTPYKQL